MSTETIKIIIWWLVTLLWAGLGLKGALSEKDRVNYEIIIFYCVAPFILILAKVFGLSID